MNRPIPQCLILIMQINSNSGQLLSLNSSFLIDTHPSFSMEPFYRIINQKRVVCYESPNGPLSTVMTRLNLRLSSSRPKKGAGGKQIAALLGEEHPV